MAKKKVILNPFTGEFDYITDVSAIESDLATIKNTDYEILYYAEINATTGTVSPPTGATIILDQMQSGADAFVSTIVGGKPSGNFPETSGGAVVDVTSFDALGNFILSGIPSAYPVALIYVFRINIMDYGNVDLDYRLEEKEVVQWEEGFPTYDTRYAQIGTDGENFEPVESITNTPPAHVLGERYLIGTSPTGAWVGYANYIAESDGASWTFTAPILDYRVFVNATLITYKYNGSSWIASTAVPLLQGGNSIGATARIGNNDNFDVVLVRKGIVMARMFNTGIQFYLNPIAPTQSTGTNNNTIATTAFVKNNLATILTRTIYNYQNTDSSVTGSTSETVIANLAVTGGIIGANGKLTIDSFVYKSGTAGIATFKYYVSTVGTNTVGTTGTPASSTLIGSNALSATQLVSAFIRDLVNKNSESANNIYPSGTSSTSDLPAQTTARTSVNINTANNFWLVVTVQLANAGDTAGTDNIQIYIDKP